jgi:hypothetical protein
MDGLLKAVPFVREAAPFGDTSRGRFVETMKLTEVLPVTLLVGLAICVVVAGMFVLALWG